MLCGGTSVILSGAFVSKTFIASCETFKNLSLLPSYGDRTSTERFRLKFEDTEENMVFFVVLLAWRCLNVLAVKLNRLCPVICSFLGHLQQCLCQQQGKIMQEHLPRGN